MSGTSEIHALAASLRERHPAWTIEIDEPGTPEGRWFVDLTHPDGRRVVIEWVPGGRWGVSGWTRGTQPFYGEGASEHRDTRDELTAYLGDLLA